MFGPRLLAPARGYRRVGNICTATDLQVVFLRKPHQNLLCSFITSPAHHIHTACIICTISRPENLHHLHHPAAKTRIERLRKRRQMHKPPHSPGPSSEALPTAKQSLVRPLLPRLNRLARTPKENIFLKNNITSNYHLELWVGSLKTPGASELILSAILEMD